jgi:hypothetical protein
MLKMRTAPPQIPLRGKALRRFSQEARGLSCPGESEFVNHWEVALPVIIVEADSPFGPRLAAGLATLEAAVGD